MAARKDLVWEVEGAVLAGAGTGEYLSDWFDSSDVFRVRVLVSGSLGGSGNHTVTVQIQESINGTDVVASISGAGAKFEADITARLWRIRATGFPADTFSGMARAL